MSTVSVEQDKKVSGTESAGVSLAKRARRLVVNTLYETGAIDWFGKQVQKRLPKVTQVSWASADAEEKFLRLTKGGFMPLMYTGHFVHLDANFMAEGFAHLQRTAEARGLDGIVRRAIEPVASTVSNGKQDPFMEVMYPYLAGHAAARNVTFFETTRQKDVDLYGAQKQKGEADVFMEFLQEPGSTALLLPYGSIQAGRHVPGSAKGVIHGLKQLYDSRTGKPIGNLVRVFTVMEYEGRRNGQKPYYLPVTLRRTYLAQDPDSYLPTAQGLISLYDRPSDLLGIFGFRRLAVEVILVTPLTADDLRSEISSNWKKRIEDTNKFLMERVAIHQLPEELGEFRYLSTPN